ncbi:hypothetical protein PYCCODRAFT_1410834 [Trametes coccinea BRFM310]|uniref:Uncharacterized protein n=1 Tax=Trametes coccinea (strain BRFM310) TaxID=1353009 RepID=A0A1Y2INZ4_TRAC3|nr:hypothetical protein PYCCODRAFT_1410834 [Trametes coccinea BRFM310]
MHQEYEKICASPRNPADGPEVEYAICSILLWSDATHLTSFGSASLWPIYLYLGNLSKYIRGMPTEFAAHHLAYIPSIPDDLRDYYMKVYGTSISDDVLTFCKRELMQRIWLLLLDDEFLEAYKHGILVECGDGVTRRIFPRIFTYSADYPEKILLTALKPLSKHPCPRCLISHGDLCNAGTPDDDEQRHINKRVDSPKLRRNIQRARKLVFQHGRSLNSKKVKQLLDGISLNPIQSAFSSRLSEFGVNFYELFVPDLMHEFELGVWKGTFKHLMRLLAAQGAAVLQEFNRRMREMPPFGRDAVRKFWSDVSARKQLAARDYEDFLIVMMPAFEGLLPLRDDETVADLLFELANWHALAKLRLHTQVTVDIFRDATKHMTEAMRQFAGTTCQRWETWELAKEAEARVRRQEKARGSTGAPTQREPKIVTFNVLNTYKYHSLPDYPDSIESTGTLDNYNTQVGELEHRHAKHYYARTNKLQYALQIAKHQRRATLLRAFRQFDPDYVPRRDRMKKQRLDAHSQKAAAASTRADIGGHEEDGRPDDPLPPTDPLDHYAMSQSRRLPIRLHEWLAQHDDDPATRDFIPILREHLLSRMLDPSEDSNSVSYTDHQLDGIEIENDRIYRHKQLRVNYTTYDMRRNQDVINPRRHRDIMLLAGDPHRTDDDHPYWYARVIDIFHANVRYIGPGATRAMRKWQRMDFLWVRWFVHDLDHLGSFQERQLPRLHFLEVQGNTAGDLFGFVDPGDVLRAAYILPGFNHGTTNELLGPSKLARRTSDNGEDYEYYYACIFADRDMYMRFLGGGVGHRGIGVSLNTSREHSHRTKPAGSAEDLMEAAADDTASEGSEAQDSEQRSQELPAQFRPMTPSNGSTQGGHKDVDDADFAQEERPFGVDSNASSDEDEVEEDDVYADGLEEDKEDELEEDEVEGDGIDEGSGVDQDWVDQEDEYIDLIFTAEGYAPL